MRSTYEASRIFNSIEGWFVVMRESDAKYLSSPKHKYIASQHLMGPFINRHRVEDWLDGYLAMHSEKRNPEEFIPDNIDPHH